MLVNIVGFFLFLGIAFSPHTPAISIFKQTLVMSTFCSVCEILPKCPLLRTVFTPGPSKCRTP